MGRHFAAPITADRHQRQPRTGRAVARGIDVGDHVIVYDPHQLIDETSLRGGAVTAGAGLFGQPAGDFGAAAGQGIAQGFHHGRAGRGCTLRGHEIGNGPGQRAPVHDRALVRDGPLGQARLFCSLSHTVR